MPFRTVSLIMFICAVILSGLFLTTTGVLADRERQSKGHDRDSSGHEREYEGHEATGTAGMFLFIVGALAPVAAISVRRLRGVGGLSAMVKSMISRLDWLRQKYFRPAHYWFNSLAIAVVAAHWALSNCGPLSLQRWMFPLLGLWALSGIVLKFGWAPKGVKPALFRFHRRWYIPALLFVIVAVGHMAGG